jgi:hypothetical protein
MNVKRTEMVTSCQRRVITGRFSIPTTPGIERVVLRIDGGDDATVWASLTADEAMALAHALMSEATGIKLR